MIDTKMTRSTLLITTILALSLWLGSPAWAQREVVDQIAVVVGEDVILASEVASQIQMVVLQTGIQPKNEQEMLDFQKRIIDDMISDRLFVIEAEKDTTISVRPEEIELALDDHISRIQQNFENEEAFHAALASEGLSLRDLRRQFREDVRNQLLKQRMIGRKLREVQVSRNEVELYYQELGDSLPGQPEGLKLAHILLSFNPSQEVEDSIRAILIDLRQQVLDGADFASISARHSDMGAGTNGGDLGYVSKEDVVPEFARVAFNLKPGDISGVVRTQFGYHVIMCTGRKESKLKLSHILKVVEPTARDTVRAEQLADSLMTLLSEGADFAQLAKTFSVDDESRGQGGELGWFAANQLPPEFAEGLSDWNVAGTYRGPVVSRFGLHLIKLLEHQSAKTFTIEEDYDQIKEMTRQMKTEKVLIDLIADIKSRTHIEMRMGG